MMSGKSPRQKRGRRRPKLNLDELRIKREFWELVVSRARRNRPMALPAPAVAVAAAVHADASNVANAKGDAQRNVESDAKIDGKTG